jgi:predicted secreted protein
MYVHGAPSAVNEHFPRGLNAGVAFFVRCDERTPTARLTESDNGTTVSVGVGARVRVVLESNASTGYSWVVTTAPDPAVVVATGEPFYAAPATSSLLGVSGHQVFDFEAVAAGTTTLQLAYQRTTAPPEAPAATWSVTLTVR